MQLRDLIRLSSLLKGSYVRGPKHSYRVTVTETRKREITIDAPNMNVARTIAEELFSIDKNIFEHFSEEKDTKVTSSVLTDDMTVEDAKNNYDYSRGLPFVFDNMSRQNFGLSYPQVGGLYVPQFWCTTRERY